MKEPLHIVEVYPRLGIGGTETYLARLARGMIQRGHRVTLLARRGGEYADEARAAGATLLLVPFGRAGRRRAASLLQDQSVDVVHAHNFTAARFARSLARSLGSAYLMTDHGIHPWYQRVTFRHWSDIVLTVSAGTRKNLAGPFGVSPDRVVVGFTGVDTGKFRPGIDSSALRAEWGAPPDHPLIVNVSRFSRRKARPALSLIEALPLIREEVPGASAVLVGGGSWWGRVAEQAERLNRKLAARVINPVGPRTDIPRVMNAADVSVAAATTAVEALACGTPTVAYGYSGYFGVVGPENLESARSAGFGDHGNLPARPPVHRFARDLLSLLKDPPAARARTDEVRNLIVERYSLEKMVDQIEDVYRDLTGRKSGMG